MSRKKINKVGFLSQEVDKKESWSEKYMGKI